LRHAQIVSWKSEAGQGDISSSLSRDGNMIAYSSISEGRSSVWIKQTSGGNPIQITSFGQDPIWSQDNQQIAFASGRADQTGIWRTPTLGGTPKFVGASRVANPKPRYWSKDGGTIYFESAANLFALNVASGQMTQVTNFNSPDPNWPADFSISPQEDRIAYVDRNDRQKDIWVAPISGGPPVRVTNDSADDKNPIWHPDGQRIVYSSLRNDTYQICIAYLDGRKPLQITSGDNDKLVAGVSSAGTKILYSALREESDIWGVRVESGEEFEVTSDMGSELWPDVSPDNKTLAFQSIKESSEGSKLDYSLIMIKPIQEGGAENQLTTGRDPRWSPDGKKLAVVRTSGGTRNIWTLNATGSDERQITTEGIGLGGNSLMPYNRRHTRDYSWSPDGKKLLYVGDGPSNVISIISSEGAGEATIVNDTNSDWFYSPLWSLDGERVIYLSQAKNNSTSGKALWKIWLTEIETGRSEVIFQGDSGLRLLGWSDQDVVAATVESFRNVAANVDLIRIAGGNSHMIGRLESAYLYNIQLSPDGKTISFASRRDGRDNIWLAPVTGGAPRKITGNTDPRLYFSSLTWSADGKSIYYGKQSRYSLIFSVDNFK
jgi:Tol biopolymer transport system component